MKKSKKIKEYLEKMSYVIFSDIKDGRNFYAIAGSINVSSEELKEFLIENKIKDIYGQPD